MKLLEMRDIVKEFPGVRALDHVSFSVNKGEILGLVGENGAGKSTLMKILSGVYPTGTYSGEITIDGSPYRVHSPAESSKYGIEMIYQEVSLHLDMSIAENLALGRWKSRAGMVKWGDIYSGARKILERVQLDLDPRQPVRSLSTSQQQLIAIGRALSHEPRILIMDEPTSSLTEKETKVLFDNMFRLKEQGISIILISHKMDEIMACTDRVIVMRDGRVVGEHITRETHPDTIVTETVGRTINQLYPPKTNHPGKELLRLENFTVRHPINKEKYIINGIDLVLYENEVLGIAGLVGAGRSELMNALFGLGGYVSGDVWLRGEKLKISNPSDAISKGFALITEDRKVNGFIGVANVVRNIALASYKRLSRFGWTNANMEKAEAKTYVRDLRIKISSLAAPVNTMSGGNQQKVVLAKWLMTHPEILLLDDPTRGIDVGTKNEFYKMIDELGGNGVSCIISSSEMPELMAMSNRIVVLSQGKIRGEFSRSQFDEKKIMNLAMGL